MINGRPVQCEGVDAGVVSKRRAVAIFISERDIFPVMDAVLFPRLRISLFAGRIRVACAECLLFLSSAAAKS